ncbi:MAG: HEPN domain-containing protein [archaeon]
MEVTNIEECFRFRLLRKIKPDQDKSKKSLQLAEQKLKRAQETINLNIYDFTILESYMAMFHSARALLYKDGIQEKSHYAIFIYLKEKYSSKIPLNILNFLNIHRTERHDAMYGLEYQPGKEDAETALKDAKIFVKEMKAMLQTER